MEAINDLFQYIISHWMEWSLAGFVAGAGILYKGLRKSIIATNRKNESIGNGMQALLRSEIIDKYNYYKEKGYCPIYAKENIKRLYGPYEALGGNDIAKNLKNELLAMDTKPKEEENAERNVNAKTDKP